MHGDYGVPPGERAGPKPKRTSLRLDAEDQRPAPTLLVFDYINWRGEQHQYAMQVESISFGSPDARWYLNGWLVTRDGDPRPEMEGNRRRSFLLTDVSNLREKEASR